MSLRENNFWEDHYKQELANFADSGEDGDVWFGRGLSRKICDWALKHLLAHKLSDQRVNIIDIGCGNGFLVFTLLNMIGQALKSQPPSDKIQVTGIDYSRSAVELANKILSTMTLCGVPEIKQCDFLNQEELKSIVGREGKRYNILIDVGTYDAICLIASESEEKLTRSKYQYMRSIYSIAHRTSIFILASCNHTEEELLPVLEYEKPNDLKIEILDRIETPKLQFGGKVGSQVTCLILQISPRD